MEIDNEKLYNMYKLIDILLGQKVCNIYNIPGTACGFYCPYSNLCDFTTAISDYLVDLGVLSEEDL